MDMTPEDRSRLNFAKELLENPGLAARLTSFVGMPFEKAFDYLPAKWNDSIRKIAEKSLRHALGVALKTINQDQGKSSSDSLHKFLVAASGGMGGAFGLPSLALELPLTTVVIFRSIADIARSEGEDIVSIQARLACLEVFALGGGSRQDNAAESGYFAIRAVLGSQVSEAAKYVLERGMAAEGAPALVKLIATIASRFGVTVSQKAAASAIPVIGAAGGALINSIFMDHFQNMARGHFIVRGLERKYGVDLVRDRYCR